MKSASKRYRAGICHKKQVAKEENLKVGLQQKVVEQQLNSSLMARKEKISRKLEESQQRRDELLKQLMERTTENERKKQDVLRRKKQIERKRRGVALKRKHRKNKKNRKKSGGGGRTPMAPSESSQTAGSVSLSLSCLSSDATFHSTDCLPAEAKPIELDEVRRTLRVLLSASKHYLDGIRPKKDWVAKCPYSELKAVVQAVGQSEEA